MDATEEQRRALDALLAYLESQGHGDLEAVRTSFAPLGETAYDVVWLAGLHSESPDFRQAYNTAVSALCSTGTLKQSLCIEQLDDEVLSACQFIESKDAFKKKIRRVRTKVL